VKILRANERFETQQPGIHTWHCFSAGSHYDPDNLSFGPLIGVDEHLVDPGAGFAEHLHRDVEIISWVAEGQLSHTSGDETQVINADESLIQDGVTIRHTERNDGEEPLRLIQTTLTSGSAAQFDVLRATADLQAGMVHLFVVDGSWSVDGIDLEAGDSVRVDDGQSHEAKGSGTVLVVRAD